MPDEYMCTECTIKFESDGVPEKCPSCNAIGEQLIKLEPEEIVVKEETTPEVTTKGDILGIRTSPKELSKLMNLIFLPSGSAPYYDKSVLNINEEGDVSVYSIKEGGILVSIIEVNKKFFGEVWGVGEIPLIGKDTLGNISMLAIFNSVTIQADTKSKILVHNAGTNARFNTNYEDASYINTNSKKYPVPILTDEFLPGKPDSQSPYVFKAVMKAASLKLLFAAASKYGIKFFPLKFNASELRAGVGDMLNPVDGAFDVEIPIVMEKSVLPTEEISVEIGPAFEYVMNNLTDEVTIHFSKSNFPLWITSEIKKSTTAEDKSTKTEVMGRCGYIITPRTASD